VHKCATSSWLPGSIAHSSDGDQWFQAVVITVSRPS
jgi:hypothetical protein